MEQIIFTTKFSKVGNQPQIRLDSKYRYFKDEKKNKTSLLKNISNRKSVSLSSILQLASTQIIKKGDLDKEMILVDLDDIDPGFGALKQERTVTEIGSDKTIFADSDIVCSKLTPDKGHFFINDKTKRYIGTTELIGYKLKNQKWDKKFLLYLLLHRNFRGDLELLTSGKTHPRIQIPDFLTMEIPDIEYFKQLEIVDKIEKIEAKISQLKQKIESTQDIIDDVFIKYEVKTKKFTESQEEHFFINSKLIGSNLFLRLGAQYYAFFEVHQGLLFNENSKYNAIPLNKILKKYKAKVLKKGRIDKLYILLDLEQLETKTGRIIDESNIVEEIGSDKVLFGDSDIVISKLRPYLAYAIINDKSKNYIGTTELVPFKLINKNISIHYIKYCLLSNEYIKKSELLMYGKEHPRIDIKDLLGIKIPIPSLEIQQKIVSEIQQREEISNQYKEEIKKLREKIDNLIYKSIM